MLDLFLYFLLFVIFHFPFQLILQMKLLSVVFQLSQKAKVSQARTRSLSIILNVFNSNSKKNKSFSHIRFITVNPIINTFEVALQSKAAYLQKINIIKYLNLAHFKVFENHFYNQLQSAQKMKASYLQLLIFCCLMQIIQCIWYKINSSQPLNIVPPSIKIITIGADQNYNIYVSLSDGQLRKYSSDLSGYTNITVPFPVQKFQFWNQTASMVQFITVAKNITKNTTVKAVSTISNNRTLVSLYDINFTLLDNVTINESIMRVYVNTVLPNGNNSFIMATVIFTDQHVFTYFKQILTMIYSYVVTFIPSVMIIAIQQNMVIQYRSSISNAQFYGDRRTVYQMSLTNNSFGQITVVTSIYYNISTSIATPSFTATYMYMSMAKLQPTVPIINTVNVVQQPTATIGIAQDANYTCYSFRSSASGIIIMDLIWNYTSPKDDIDRPISNMPLMTFFNNSGQLILIQSNGYNAITDFKPLTYIAQYSNYPNNVLPNSTYDRIRTKYFDIIYQPGLSSKILKGGYCMGTNISSVAFPTFTTKCIPYVCSKPNCIYCPIVPGMCGNCSIGYMLVYHNYSCVLIPNITNTTNATNATNATNSTNATNTTNSTNATNATNSTNSTNTNSSSNGPQETKINTTNTSLLQANSTSVNTTNDNSSTFDNSTNEFNDGDDTTNNYTTDNNSSNKFDQNQTDNNSTTANNSTYLQNSTIIDFNDNFTNQTTNNTNSTNSTIDNFNNQSQINNTNSISNDTYYGNNSTVPFQEQYYDPFSFFLFQLQFLRVIFQYFYYLIESMLMALNEAIQYPVARQIFSPIFYYFGNFEDLFFYQFHDRTYNQAINSLFAQISQIQNKKWSLINSTQLFAKVGVDSSLLINLTNYQSEYLTYNYSNLNHTKTGSEAVLANCLNFFVVTIPLTLIVFVSLHLLFHLTFRFQISILLRKFDFWMFFLVLLFEGNIQQFAFYLSADWSTIFAFTFPQKLIKICVILFGLVIVLVSFSVPLISFALYRKLNKYLLDNNKNSLSGSSLFLLQNYSRNFTFGVLNSYLRYLGYYPMVICLISTDIFYFLVFISFMGSKIFLVKMKMWFYIFLNFFKVILLVTFICDYENKGISMLDVVQQYTILLLIATYTFGVSNEIILLIGQNLKNFVHYIQSKCKNKNMEHEQQMPMNTKYKLNSSKIKKKFKVKGVQFKINMQTGLVHSTKPAKNKLKVVKSKTTAAETMSSCTMKLLPIQSGKLKFYIKDL